MKNRRHQLLCRRFIFMDISSPKPGFGLMRLPRKGPFTDVEQVKTMVDRFLEAGFTYFDTAFVYLGSEDAARKALVERYSRDSRTLLPAAQWIWGCLPRRVTQPV